MGDLPLRWFCALSEGSISSRWQLWNSFLEKFQAPRAIPKTDADLMALKMRQIENVTQFAKRFWTIYNQIENASDEVVVKSFRQALLPSNELRKDLVQFPVVTMKALMARVNRFIEQEEEEARAQESFGLCQEDKPSKKDKRSSRREEADQNKALSSSAVASVPTSGAARNPSQ